VLNILTNCMFVCEKYWQNYTAQNWILFGNLLCTFYTEVCSLWGEKERAEISVTCWHHWLHL